MNKVIEYIIGAKDATANAVKSALNRIKSFAAGVGSNLQNIRAGFAMLGTAANKAVEFMRKAFAFEKMTVQFKTLIGNMDEARDHMKMLQELGDTPPFSLEEFAAASRSMMVMTDGALGFRKSLEMVGDAAAATGQPIDALAHEVGRAYAIIRDGQPLTRATMSLRNMGVLTPEVAQKLQDLQDAGASTTEIWQEMEKALSRYKGAMEETEQTGEGLMGAISAQWDDTLREFGAACLETSKDALGGLLEWMKQLREDGSISVWANKAGRAFAEVAEFAKGCASAVSKVVETYGKIRDWMAEKGAAIGGFVGTLASGGSWEDAKNAASQSAEQERNEQKARDAENAASDEKARAAGVERARKSAKDKAESERAEQEKIRKSLEDGQRKITARNAEEEKKKRIEAERAIAKEREKLQKKNAEQLRKDLSDAQSILATAQANSAQAWGWYRDKNSWKAQISEERENRRAEARFQNEFRSLSIMRPDWRTATNLSDSQEIVRRVALAREQENAAAEYEKVTAEATKRSADALEKMQTIFEGANAS